MSVTWNPWHGCHKLSEGCANCYVYRIDGKFERCAFEVSLNSSHDLPLRKGRTASGYKIPSGETVYTCFSSDFLLEDADEWRTEAWKIMSIRKDLKFIFFTKRILRLESVLPSDWGDGYDNVFIGCTCENQKRADERLPKFLSLPIKHRFIVCEPLLESIDLSEYLSDKIEYVIAGGESGDGARLCDYSWVLGIRDNCIMAHTDFSYHQTGAKLRKDGKIYNIPRKYQSSQAKKAGVDVSFGGFTQNDIPSDELD